MSHNREALPPSLVTTPARTVAERNMVDALRHEVFGADAVPSALHDRYDDARNCQSFLLYRQDNGAPVGSIRACIYSAAFDWRPVPAFDLYDHEITSTFAAGVSFVQSSHFCISSVHRGLPLLPKLLLIREILRTAVVHSAANVITIVKDQPAQLRFYKRMGFDPLGPAKPHPLAKCQGILIGVATDTFLRMVQQSRLLQPIGEF